MSDDKPGGGGESAGRGVLFIAAAKLYFLVAGAIIEFRLPVIFSATTFGAYKVVAGLVSPLNNVIITGTIQAVSRFTAQDPARARAVQRAAFRMHLFVGLGLAVLFAALSPAFAAFFEDASKVGPIALAAAIVAGYSMYAVFVGRANGEKHFHKQAGLDVCFATLRAGGILGLATVGLGLYGAISGWVIAVGAILVVAAVWVGLPGRRLESEQAQAIRPLLAFFASVAFYLFCLNVIMVVDSLLLKRLASHWYDDHAGEAAAYVARHAPPWLEAQIGALSPARAADAQVGFYAAVQNLARLPYQAIIAATFVIFPLVSRTTFVSDREATKRYVVTTMRYATIFATAMAVVFAANPVELLGVPYPRTYAAMGGWALIALALGNVAFSVFVIAGTILNGAGHTRAAITSAVVTVVSAAAANAVVIPMFRPGRELLFACACATGTAMLLGAALGCVLLKRKLGATLPLATALRVSLGVVAIVLAGRSLATEGTPMILAESAALGLAFLAALIALRELGGADLKAVLGSLSRGSR